MTYDRIVSVLENLGISVDRTDEDIDLTQYTLNSLIFVSFVVEVERIFDITLPDYCLIFDNYRSLRGFAATVDELLYEKEKESEKA